MTTRVAMRCESGLYINNKSYKYTGVGKSIQESFVQELQW
ncbi:hypothetical protein V6Z12_A06G078400 [Gossypium hirsutum]